MFETKNIRSCNIYVDDILPTSDHTRITDEEILNTMNNVHPTVEFKLTVEDNESVSFLDLLIMGRRTN
jgi:hypothetical protein